MDLGSKALKIFKHRPLHFFQYARGYVLFRMTALLRALFPLLGQNIRLGRNVRLQRLGCLRAELPNAGIEIGEHSIIYENARCEAYGQGRIEIGACTVLGDVKIFSRSKIRMGKRVVTSWNVLIQDFDPHPVKARLRAIQIHNLCAHFRPSDFSLLPLSSAFDEGQPAFAQAPIEIGDDVWIGANATILKGATIGSGSIVGAGAVVAGGIWPSHSLIAGNPARLIRTLD